MIQETRLSINAAAGSDLHVGNIRKHHLLCSGVSDHHEQRVHLIDGTTGASPNLVGLIELLDAVSQVVAPREGDGAETLAVVGGEGLWVKDPRQAEVKVKINHKVSDATVYGGGVVFAEGAVDNLPSLSPPPPQLCGHIFSDGGHHQLWSTVVHFRVHCGTVVSDKLDRRRQKRTVGYRERAIYHNLQFKGVVQANLGPFVYSLQHVKRVILVMNKFHVLGGHKQSLHFLSVLSPHVENLYILKHIVTL